MHHTELQSVFDETASKILAQGAPSVGPEGDCRYAGDHGRGCGIGVHLSRELGAELDHVGKGKSVSWVAVYSLVGELGERIEKELNDSFGSGWRSNLRFLDFMVELQTAHDDAAQYQDSLVHSFIGKYCQFMTIVAQRYGLNDNVLG